VLMLCVEAQLRGIEATRMIVERWFVFCGLEPWGCDRTG
jgi:hypothetical protein